MTAKKPKASNAEAQRQSAAVTRVTGEQFCQSSAHFTRAPMLKVGRRSICQPCKERLDLITRKSRQA